MDFQIKLRDPFFMTLSSLSFLVFVDPYQGINGVCLLSYLKIYGIFGIKHSNIVPSLSHHITNCLLWSSWVGRQLIHTCKHLLKIQTIDLEKQVIQSNQDVHVCGIWRMVGVSAYEGEYMMVMVKA